MSTGNGVLTANSQGSLIVAENGTGTLLVGGTSVVNAQSFQLAVTRGWRRQIENRGDRQRAERSCLRTSIPHLVGKLYAQWRNAERR